jgi:hypothetical protein
VEVIHMTEIKNISDSRKVIVPVSGHNYHLFNDCYGIKLGRQFHLDAGHGIDGDCDFTVGDAISSGKFACRVCYKRAGHAIPSEGDRVAIRAAARAERLARKAAKAAAKAPIVAPVTLVAEDDALGKINADLAILFALIGKLINARKELLAA